jgi:release factor glutamine methyltransferase
MTVEEARKYGIKLLKERGAEGPESSADFLLRKILKLSKERLALENTRKLNIFEERKLRKWLLRRAKHEPVWYIAGEIEFFGQDLIVKEGVLIPRPETEILVEMILKNEQKKSLKILDVGTGSGAIILSLAKKMKGEYYASDVSKDALSVAKKNAKRLKHLVLFKEGDLLSPWIGNKFDVIVANLPYVPHEEMPSLAFDLIHYEPRKALDGGEKGVQIYKRFFKELPEVLETGARVYCEIGDGQGEVLKELVTEVLPGARVEAKKDYGGHERYLFIELQ